ncbi:MAG: 50S ribosomal protein L29 [Zetaproteobacteria bacterium]|nr:50S ribosomal protein L29 [Zetaproteobacteria bacterium]
MKVKALRELSAVDLKSRLDDLGSEAMKLRFQQATMQLTHTARIGQVRQEVARIKTILAERS